ncbi:MAG: transporter ATP-binding protein [Bacillales bacterium]|nr:transporter ATP-binding protein [Bacillales bacterium]
MLKLHDLSKVFGSQTAVKNFNYNINLDAHEKSCIALLGPNGAGKTTTLKMLTGLIKPTSGTIVSDQMNGDLRNYIGYLPQYPSYYDWMSANEFLFYVGELSGLNKNILKTRISEVLHSVGLKDVGRKRIGNYSGGMKQRLGIAQAIIHKPKLLILDEPVSALDPIGRREVMDLLNKLKKETTIIYSTHVLHDAEEISDEILIMNKGEIIETGSLKSLKLKYQKPIIYIQSDNKIGNWINELSYIKEVKRESDNSVTITIEDEPESRTRLLEDLIRNNIEISKFVVGESTLEEMFFKVVQ